MALIELKLKSAFKLKSVQEQLNLINADYSIIN